MVHMRWLLNTYQLMHRLTYQHTKNPLHISSNLTINNADEYIRRCAPTVSCDPNAKYRTINGSCNNLLSPTMGAAETPFLRLLDAEFGDGYYELRKQINGSALPSARLINDKIFMGRELYHVDENNILLLPFAQLLAHDITGLPDDTLFDEQGVLVNCATDKIARKTFTQCQAAVDFPPDDPVYGKYNVTGMNNYRSLTSRNYSCPLFPTTFMNVNTQFIDASEVYGSKENVTKHLRLMEGGRLRFSVSENGQMFCPFIGSKEGVEFSSNKRPHGIHYDTGDPKNGNQNLGITAMQTLFLRFHNYITYKLSALNPNWSDETLYQEARRIVIATIQRIAYEDFLPIVIGDDFQEAYGINNENIYSPTVSPATSQELSSAAFRVL
ncbi:chorion peroxidase-like, partial [Sipha flava]|uniref:Chorion peroxidase-like n=1 Tax=Sipha flava TaxID=143950 RepID=A0A8B8FH85_9HEMI